VNNLVTDFYQLVCEKMNYGLLLLDEKGIILFFNQALVSMLGLKKNELIIGRNAKEISCQFMQTILAQPKIQAIHRNESNGRRLWVVPQKIGQPPSAQGQFFLIEDVTERETLRQGLHETSMYKSILEQILENAYEGVVVTDSEGIIMMFNAAYANYLEIRSQDAIGQHVTKVIDNTRVHEVVKSGVPEFGKLQKIGSHKAVVTRLPITFNKKVIAGVGIVHYRELTDMKRLVEKLSSLESELAQIKEEYGKNQVKRYSIQDIIGNSRPIMDLKKQIHKAAASSSTVLILGENGTGKELVAHSLHQLSGRSDKPFVKINCAAIPGEILESELFGYVGGAFTGSNRGGKQGKFEMADGGTIFLDEIGDMSFHMQAKLLRFLQEKEIERLGENKVRAVDVRVLAATNQNLVERIKTNQFREDLYYRLQVVQLDVPPLRNRMEDIDVLIRYFIEKFNRIFGKKVQDVSTDAVEIIRDYHWPGNVRQLENVMERAFNMVEIDKILVEHLPPYLIEGLPGQARFGAEIQATILSNSNEREAGNLSNAKELLERKQIEKALSCSHGNKSEAAKRMGITRTTLYQKMKKYGLKL
jgi:PAS domain S-box-containing protein